MEIYFNRFVGFRIVYNLNKCNAVMIVEVTRVQNRILTAVKSELNGNFLEFFLSMWSNYFCFVIEIFIKCNDFRSLWNVQASTWPKKIHNYVYEIQNAMLQQSQEPVQNCWFYGGLNRNFDSCQIFYNCNISTSLSFLIIHVKYDKKEKKNVKFF